MKLRSAILPTPRVLRQAEVYAYLGRQTADEAIKAGKLKPCATKPSERGPQRKFYALKDVMAVEDTILDGTIWGEVK